MSGSQQSAVWSKGSADVFFTSAAVCWGFLNEPRTYKSGPRYLATSLKLGAKLLDMKEVVTIKAVDAPARRRRLRLRPTAREHGASRSPPTGRATSESPSAATAG